MPFQSEAQRRFMYANHPKMAAEWESKTPKGKLPAKVSKTNYSPDVVALAAKMKK